MAMPCGWNGKCPPAKRHSAQLSPTKRQRRPTVSPQSVADALADAQLLPRKASQRPRRRPTVTPQSVADACAGSPLKGILSILNYNVYLMHNCNMGKSRHADTINIQEVKTCFT